MKTKGIELKLALTLLMLSMQLATYSQAPQGFSYQAVVRDGSGSPIANKMVAIRISLQNATQVSYYTETHSKQTNPQGVVSLIIGGGTQSGGNAFSSIPWANGDVHLKIEIDPDNGTNFTTLVDATKLQSVPYSLYSANGTPGADGISINWRGSFSSDPSTPNLNDAYYNTLAKKSYIYDKNNTWQILAQDGANGTNGTNGTNGANGISLIWKGTSATAPTSPSTNWAYYNSSLKKSYVYDGSTWQILAQDGMPINGTASQTLYYDAANGWSPSSVLLNDNTNLGVGIAPTTKFDVNGGIRLRGALYDGTATPLTPGTSNQILTSTGTGVLWKSPSTLNLASGTGTTGQLALWTGTNSGLQGISNLSWGTNLQVQSISTAGPDDPIMEVRNKNGQVVFAVYQSGVRMYVDGITAKGAKGGFAVGGLTGKAPSDYFVITPDSARVRLKTPVKGAKGGFAVGGLTSKGGENYLQLTPNNYFIGHDAGKAISSGLYNSFMGYQSGQGTTTGSSNVFLGYQSGFINTIGKRNTFLGHKTGYSNSSGYSNVFIGDSTGYDNTTGRFNVFVGSNTGAKNVTGIYNAFLGYQAGYNSNADYNTFMGYQAGYSTTWGFMNLFLGYTAGFNNIGGHKNTFLGYNSGKYNLNGYDNTFIGAHAGYGFNDGNANVMIGVSAGNYFYGGIDNIFIGNGSGYGVKNSTTTANNNIFIGSDAGRVISTGNNNLFVGTESGRNNNSGGYNTFFGYQSGYSNTSGSNNLFIGYQSGFTNTTGDINLFLGYQSGYSNTTGSDNLFVGKYTGFANTTGSRNTFFGSNSGDSNIDGFDNLFIGYNSGSSTTSGNSNTFLGSSAGATNSLGSHNTFIGYMSGYLNTTGSNNTFYGKYSGYSNTSGYYNIFMGYTAGGSNTTGNSNIYIGDQTAYYNSTGYNNVFLGYQSGYNTTGYGNVFLGYNAGYNETGSNRLYIDNSSTTAPLIGGDFANNRVGINRIPTTYALEVGGAIWANGSTISAGATTWSDARFKTNIVTISNALFNVCNLRGVTYDWDNSNKNTANFPIGKQIGVIAQEVEKIFPELVQTGEDGYKSVSYEKMSALFIEAIKEQQKIIDTQQKQIDKQNQQYNELKDELDAIKALLKK